MKKIKVPLDSDYNKPKREDYRLVITDAWKDIHHSRVQEWSSLGVVIAIHVAIIQLFDFINKAPGDLKTAIIITGGIGIFFSFVGIGITNRHRILMIEKLNWITIAEFKLGLLIDFENKLSTNINRYGVIPLGKSMIKKLDYFNELLNAEIKGVKCKNYYGFKYIRLKSTSSLLMLFYLTLIALDGFLLYYYLVF